MIDSKFWQDKRVLVSGHTGFKGAWLSILLKSLGAKVFGVALAPPTEPNLFTICRLSSLIDQHDLVDIRDLNALKSVVENTKPEIVLHLAAQALVQDSYRDPLTTYSTNVLGTGNLLEAIRYTDCIRATVIVTTDKVYQDQKWLWGYRESDRLGGYDPYSNSKACAELLTTSYVNSFFNPQEYSNHKKAFATARAGNVIGGGDWAKNRILPDCIRAAIYQEKLQIRNPQAIRPWQHVLEPLSGYLTLAQKLYLNGCEFSGAWNFGPDNEGIRSVEWIVKEFAANWQSPINIDFLKSSDFGHETQCLKLDSEKSRNLLLWKPRWKIETAVKKVAEWTKVYVDKQDVLQETKKQIKNYLE